MIEQAQNQNLTELKQTIDRVARKLDYLFRLLKVDYPDEAVPVYVLEAQELVRQGRESEAVKIIREQTAVGIIEARAIVDDMARRVRRDGEAEAQVRVSTEQLISEPGPAADQAAVDAAWREAVRAARDGA